MTFGGARGETAEEMARVLHFGNHSELVPRAAHDVLHTWSSSNTPIAIRSINRMFGQKSYPYEMNFLKSIERDFGAPIELVDFIKDPERARQRMNISITRATEYRISEAIPPGGIDSDSRLVLVNANRAVSMVTPQGKTSATTISREPTQRRFLWQRRLGHIRRRGFTNRRGMLSKGVLTLQFQRRA